MAKKEDIRSPATIDHHRKIIAELYLKQWRQVDIAEKLGIDQATVSRDLSAVRKMWRKDASLSFDAAKAQELARIDTLENEYWRQYEASQEEFVRTMTEKNLPPVTEGGRQKEGTTKARVIKETRIGDPRYLSGIQWCIEQRCKILGIEAPKKTDMTSGGKPFQVIIKHADDSDPDYN